MQELNEMLWVIAQEKGQSTAEQPMNEEQQRLSELGSLASILEPIDG